MPWDFDTGRRLTHTAFAFTSRCVLVYSVKGGAEGAEDSMASPLFESSAPKPTQDAMLFGLAGLEALTGCDARLGFW